MNERVEPTLKIKLPTELKHWLKIQSAKNLRSMTAEIVLAVMERRERLEKEEK